MQGITKAILLTTTLIAWINCFTQDRQLTEILAAKNDTSKVMRLNEYAQSIRHTNPGLATELCHEMIKISKPLGFNKGIGIALLKIGYMKSAAANENEAIVDMHNAITYLEAAGLSNKVAGCYINLGTSHRRLGHVDSAILYYTKAAALAEQNNHMQETIISYNNLGALFLDREELNKTLFYFNKSLENARKGHDSLFIVENLMALSTTWRRMKDFKNALPPAKQALQIANQTKDVYQKTLAYFGMAEYYVDTKNGGEAIVFAKGTTAFAKQSNAAYYYLLGLLNLSDAYGLLNNNKEQLNYLDSAISAWKETGASQVFGQDIYKRLSNAHFSAGNFKEAFVALQKLNAYNDSTNNDQNNKIVNELEIKYQTAQKEIALQKSRQQTVNIILLAAALLLLVGLLAYSVQQRKKRHVRELRALHQEKEIQLLQALMQGEEKERSRIARDLHDGVAGMLAAVKMHFSSICLHVGDVLNTEGYRQGIKLLDDASHEVRKTSHNLMPEVLVQHGLDHALHRYCKNISNGTQLVVQYDSLGEPVRYKDSFELSVYRIVQELLNNILKHSKATDANVQLSFQSGLLSITVEDNGVGISTANLQREGMGLRSLQSRVKAINGRMELDSEEGQGVNAYLEFETSGLEIQEKAGDHAQTELTETSK